MYSSDIRASYEYMLAIVWNILLEFSTNVKFIVRFSIKKLISGFLFNDRCTF
jgi:hypothetical protein